jgi:glucose-6-phosphate 1-dehydrogenase
LRNERYEIAEMNQPEHKRMTVVIFGSTGNLTGDKLLPALENSLDDPLVGGDLTIVAVGRRDLDDSSYYGLMSGQLKTNYLKDKILYFKGDVGRPDGLSGLGRFLAERGLEDTDIIYYCATPPGFFETISRQLHEYELADTTADGPFRRVVFEKPFGQDMISAGSLLDSIYGYFQEDQVILIDHYLGKEAIQNLLILRFMNNLYEATLRSEYVQEIQITVSEKEGIGDRGQYYDDSGVIKDMLQNHILQIIAFLTMERPRENSVEDILKNKLQAIKNIRYATPLSDSLLIGQYQGYREEKYIPPDSRTPTYLALKLFVEVGPLKDVPIFIRTGKALEKKQARIVIQLKAKRSPFNGELLRGNKIVVTIQPDAWVMFFFNHKIPGLTMEVKEVTQCFFREDTFVESPREGYHRLFSEIIRGNRLLFTRAGEVIASWIFIDKLLGQIKEEGITPVVYTRGIYDLPESRAMLQHHGIVWHEEWHSKGDC